VISPIARCDMPTDLHQPTERTLVAPLAVAGVAMRRPGPAPLQTIDLRRWQGPASPVEREQALQALEAGKIVFLPHLGFELTARERRFLDPRVSDGKRKNVSFDPRNSRVHGTSLTGADREELAALLRRFGEAARALIEDLFPDYAPRLEIGRASLRPGAIDGRNISSHKDDSRLHIDAFPSQPLQGRRILRLFANVNPDGLPRVWRVGGDFSEYVARFLPRWSHPVPGFSATLAMLGVTKGWRTDYDWLMLSLHDRAKADNTYQREGILAELRFPAGSAWTLFTDLVPHAAIAGQHVLEQTFYLPVGAMHDPAAAPLSILEERTRRRLTTGSVC